MQSSSFRILIIDDSEFSCELLSLMLSSEKYQVSGVASDALSGIEMALSLQPDLIFLDIIMPGISGIDAILPLKKSSPNADIVMVSGDGDQSQIAAAKQLGALAYITKPFNIADILGTMKSIQSRRSQAGS